MSEKDRKVTSVGVVKESSELRKERELAKQGVKWSEKPPHETESQRVEPPSPKNEEEEKDKE